METQQGFAGQYQIQATFLRPWTLYPPLVQNPTPSMDPHTMLFATAKPSTLSLTLELPHFKTLNPADPTRL